jgi:hypothetical protein
MSVENHLNLQSRFTGSAESREARGFDNEA